MTDSSLTPADVLEIHQVLALFSHVFDNGDAESLSLVFTEDAVVENGIGRGYSLPGLEAVREFTRNHRTGTVDHHTLETVILVDEDDGTVRARSRYLSMIPSGEMHNGDFLDELVRTPGGWRISYRMSVPRMPGLAAVPPPAELLERWTVRSGREPVSLTALAAARAQDA